MRPRDSATNERACADFVLFHKMDRRLAEGEESADRDGPSGAESGCGEV